MSDEINLSVALEGNVNLDVLEAMAREVEDPWAMSHEETLARVVTLATLAPVLISEARKYRAMKKSVQSLADTIDSRPSDEKTVDRDWLLDELDYALGEK